MFSNPIVIGTLRRHPRGRGGELEERAGALASIVDRSTWARVQRMVEERGKYRRSKRSDRYVFSSAARCRDCDSRFWGHNAGSGQYRYRRLEHRPGGCGGVHHEKLIIEAFGAFFASWRLRATAKARIARYLARNVEDGATARRPQLEGELTRLADLYRWGHIDSAVCLAQRQDVERILAAIPAVARPPSDNAIALVSQLGEVWKKATDAERRRIVDEWFEEVRLGRDRTIEVIVRAPYRELVFDAYGQGQSTQVVHVDERVVDAAASCWIPGRR